MATDKRAGFVYLLTNPSINGKVKIGRVESDDLQKLKARIRALSSHAGVPEKFELRYAVRVDDVDKAETLLHEAFGWVRKNKNREFFDIAPEKVEAAMKLTLVRGSDCVPVALVDAYALPMKSGNTPPPSPPPLPTTTPTKKGERRSPFKRPPFKFGDYGIPVGAELVFIGDSSLKATVADNNNTVKFKGEIMPLGMAARKAFQKIGNTRPMAWGGIRGGAYWKYNGVLLKDL